VSDTKSNVVRFKRKPRPLRKRYDPAMPFSVEREDLDDGSITYSVVDLRPDSCRTLCEMNDQCHDQCRDEDMPDDISTTAKSDAEMIVRALNLLHSYKGTKS